jgi:hypothetical protein
VSSILILSTIHALASAERHRAFATYNLTQFFARLGRATSLP